MKTFKVLGMVASTISSAFAMENTAENKQPADTNFTQYEDAALTPMMCGVISGYGSLRKIECGTLTLTGSNTYTGGSTDKDGTLTTEGTNALGSNLIYEKKDTVDLHDELDVEEQH